MVHILRETGRPDAEEQLLAGSQQKTFETCRTEVRTDRWMKNQSNQQAGASVLLSGGCTKVPILKKGKVLLCLAIHKGRSHSWRPFVIGNHRQIPGRTDS